MSYCTVDDLKAFGYAITDDDTANLTRLCEAATARVDAYCHQSFALTKGRSEKHTVRIKDGAVCIFPDNLTINTINSIEYVAFRCKSFPYVITDPLYIKDSTIILAATNAPDGEMVIDLNYDFGYDTLPADLVQACAFMAVPFLDDYFSAKEAGIAGLKLLEQGKLKIERGAVSASSRLNTDGVPLNAASILDGGGYVRVRSDYL
jgi:hypothetical protein